MKKMLILLLFLSTPVSAQQHNTGIGDLIGLFSSDSQQQNNSSQNAYELNAYGNGVGMDRSGRPFRHDPNLQLEPNVYGPGIGQDQFGRSVRHPQ